MKILAVSDQVKGILLIVGGIALVLNYFEIIQLLEPIIAIVGLIMIGLGVVLAKLHEKVYLLIKKDDKPNNQDQNQQPPQSF